MKFDGTLPSFESASDPTIAELHHYLAVDYVEGYEFQLVLLEFLMHLYDCCQAFQEVLRLTLIPIWCVENDLTYFPSVVLCIPDIRETAGGAALPR